MPAVSLITGHNIGASLCRYDNTCCSSLPRWTLHIAVSYGESDHTLPTILSKFFSHALCKVGVLGELHCYGEYSIVDYEFRCAALPHNLDGQVGRHSHVHTEALLAKYDLKTLWNDYGVVGDLLVRHILSFI